MKKQLSLILCVIITAAILFGTSGCYLSKPGKMKDLVGTYELTSYTYRTKDQPSEEESENRIETRNITAYLVITADGNGYYVYRDKDVALNVQSVKITYTMDDEETDKVDKIVYNTGVGTSAAVPGSGRETLGLTFSLRKKTLNYSIPAVFGRDYSTSVSYTKVDKATDLSYVNKKLKANLSANRYELNGMNGRFYSDRYSYGGEDYPYLYYVVDVHGTTADVYYALKADPTPVKKTNLPITVSDGITGNDVVFSIDGKRYQRYLGETFSTYLTELNEQNEYVDSLYYSTETADELIAIATAPNPDTSGNN